MTNINRMGLELTSTCPSDMYLTNLVAGTNASHRQVLTLPMDTAKVRLQVQAGSTKYK